MGKLIIRKLKPGETLLGGGKGILMPFKPTPAATTTTNSPSTSTKTPEQLKELQEMERMASIEAYESIEGHPYREEEHGQEKTE